MTENKPEFDPRLADFADNPEPRCPCILLLDTSGSMAGAPIDQLNAGLQAFCEGLVKDRLAALRVEVAIITFGRQPVLAQNFVTADQFKPPTLAAGGATPIGAAINLALDTLEARKALYKQSGTGYYRPWIFLITDGEPTDEWKTAAQRVQAANENKGVAFFTVGVDKVDLKLLSQIAPPDRPPRLLRGLEFSNLFVWLSQSLTAVSHSRAGEQVPLKPAAGWTEV
jgi:uncharacterized protein YegL